MEGSGYFSHWRVGFGGFDWVFRGLYESFRGKEGDPDVVRNSISDLKKYLCLPKCFLLAFSMICDGYPYQNPHPYPFTPLSTVISKISLLTVFPFKI